MTDISVFSQFGNVVVCLPWMTALALPGCPGGHLQASEALAR